MPGLEDPRRLLEPEGLDREGFSRCVSSIWIENTWKATKPRRHLDSDAALLRLVGERRVSVLDAGASDGSTSLDLIEKLGGRFESYHVTDLAFSLNFARVRRTVYFYDRRRNRPSIAAGDSIIAFAGQGSGFRPLAWWANRLVARAPREADGKVFLVQPDLVRIAEEDPRVKLMEWSIVEPWGRASVDVLKAANLLNRIYFDSRQLETAVRNMFEALQPGGLLMIVENREREQWSCFRKEMGRLRSVADGREGSDIRDLVASWA